MGQSILITEDDRVQREIIRDILAQSGFDVTASDSAETTLGILKDQTFELMVTDLRMPGMDGLELLRQSKRLRPELEVVVMTAHATIRTAVTAMKEGAIDYLEKPFDKDGCSIISAPWAREPAKENRRLREMVEATLARQPDRREPAVSHLQATAGRPRQQHRSFSANPARAR